MNSLRALLFPEPMRHYALLDRHGICRALRQSQKPPTKGCWVEVEECSPSWLDRPLPAHARLDRQPAKHSPAALAH